MKRSRQECSCFLTICSKADKRVRIRSRLNNVLRSGYDQAKSGEGLSVDEAFAKIREESRFLELFTKLCCRTYHCCPYLVADYIILYRSQYEEMSETEL